MQGSVCPELQINSQKTVDQRQSLASRCHVPKFIDTRNIVDPHAMKGFLGNGGKPVLPNF